MSGSIEVKLLGQVNKQLVGAGNARISPKHVIVVTAAQIFQYIRYKKIGKKNPYQVDPLSLIKLDKKAQRGISDDGFAFQDESKVAEIRDVLLGVSKEAAQMYLGTLVWNVRPGNGAELKKIVETDPDNPHIPPLYKLRITSDTIWLTDSAHRHFGIAEAVAAWRRDKDKYPDFSDTFEFSIDLFNLDAVQENALFRELNAKQKKITASKAQQTDTGSALGLLKSTILAKDQSDKKLFDQNIEVNSNENSRHTLMTMSVFTASVQNMFGKATIEAARKSEHLRDELAQYYCDFFYALRDYIRVKIDRRGETIEVTPFQNLYETTIAPAIDKMAEETDESKINAALSIARDKANALNQDIQNEEKIHSNAVVKALSRIAKRIQFVSGWQRVVQLLQTDLIAQNGGQYFQKTNLSLFESQNGAAPIAIKKADGTMNIQVQDQVIREIERHLTSALSLNFDADVRLRYQGHTIDAPEERVGFTGILRRVSETYFDVEIDFPVGANLDLSEDNIRLRIEALLPTGAQWKNADKVGKARLMPVQLSVIEGFDHAIYPGGFKKYSAKFEVTLPMYSDLKPGTVDLQLDLDIVDIDGSSLRVRRLLPMQPEV
ncbi:hypothetical protein [Paraburkholderia sp. 40]|uniref:hypothetical protein n=1 Tax=Paraburkholderia sp. 40 TaxID=2991059 RepID=UPI003D1CEED7